MIAAIATAALVTALATPLVRALARRASLVDHPNERSSHSTPVPRSGGLAVLAGVVAGLAASGATPGRLDLQWAAFSAGLVLVSLVGLLDDRLRLPWWPRLACHVLAATGVAWTAGGLDRLPLPAPLDLPLGPLAVPAAVLWIVAVLNFFNFMDGIDGIAASQAAITAGALALVLADPLAVALAWVVSASALVFLLYNWNPASVFLGDLGSGALGYILGASALMAPSRRRSDAVFLLGVSLFLFLADATTCLLRRAQSGERLHEAHRSHLYQRWVAAGRSHAYVTSRVAAGAFVLTALALWAWTRADAASGWAALGASVALFALEWRAVRGDERARHAR